MQAEEGGAPNAAHINDSTSEPGGRLNNQSQLFRRESVTEGKSPENKEQSCTKELKCVFYSLAAVLAVMLTLVLVFLAVSGQLEGFSLHSTTSTLTENDGGHSEMDSSVSHLPSGGDHLDELNHNYNVTEDIHDEENEITNEDFHLYNSTHYIQYFYIDLNSTDIDFDLVNQTEFLEQLKQNDTGIEGIERLEDLNAEALIGGSPQSRGYVAYIPVPINNNSNDDDDDDDDDEEDEEDTHSRRKPARPKNRPVKVPYLVPIMMMPSSAIHGGGQNQQQSSLNNARFFPGSRNFLTSMVQPGSYPSYFGNNQHVGALNPNSMGTYGSFYANANTDNVRQASSPLSNVLLSSGTLGPQPSSMVVNNFQEPMQNSNYAPVVTLPTGVNHREPSVSSYSQQQNRANYPSIARNSAIDHRIFGTLASDQSSSVPRTHRESFANSNSRHFNQPAPGRGPFGRYSPRNGWAYAPPSGNQENYFQPNRPVNRPYDNRRPPPRFDNRMDNPNYRAGRPHPLPASNNYPRSPSDDPRWGPQSRYPPSANPMSIQDIISYMTALGAEENSNAKFSNTQYSSSNNYDSRNRGGVYTNYQSSSSSNYRNNNYKQKEPIAMMMDIYPAPADSHQNRPYDTHGYRQHTSNSYQYSRYPGHRERERDRDRDRERERVRNYDTQGKDSYEHQRNSDLHEADYVSPVYVAKSPPTHHPRPSTHLDKDDEEPKHKVVLHLNLYPRRPSTTGNKNRVGIDRDTHQDAEDGYLLSSADIYREAMRNAAAKRDGFPGESDEDYGASTVVKSHKEGPRDDGLPGGESKVLVSHKITTDHDIETSKSHRTGDDFYELHKNHRMPDQGRSTSQSNIRSSSYPISSFEDDEYEPLPLPLPQTEGDNSTTASSEESIDISTLSSETTKEKDEKQDAKPSMFSQLFG